MKKKRRPISYKIERAVLSDVLPYEIPVIFSNRHFYNFLTENEVKITDKNKIEFSNNNRGLEAIKKLLFGDEKNIRTIPFNYKISHKISDFRELSLVHPKNQVALVDFYNKYKDLILYYCNTSPFSIRMPYKVATLIYFEDWTHKLRLAKDQEYEAIEEASQEYENLKTFFAYKDYSNIHKFYESYKYHRCEKKYDKMFKFDISQCFDSIYTHSINWAQLNKKVVKDNIGKSDTTFAGKFDIFMQNVNYGETNGIVIGPEFSRIFAEIILQKIDKNVFSKLEEDKIKHKMDYEIFRYVDDYFLFYNQEKHKDKILTEYKLALSEYKLRINSLKTEDFSKPIITDITIAKQKISDLLNLYLTFKTEDTDDGKEKEEDGEKSIYVSSNILITKFKTVIKETDVEYKDILNYTLAIIDRKLTRLIKDYDKYKEQSFMKAVFEILEFTFFIYAVSPRVNTTIKLCLILSKLTNFLRKNRKSINIDNTHLIKKEISDELSFILRKNIATMCEHTQIETLYLLIALRELGKDYLLDKKTLLSYFQAEMKEKPKFNIKLNYFSIIVLLFYIKDKTMYKDIKEELEKEIVKKYSGINKKELGKNTELVLLLMDLLTCPYLSNKYKKDLLKIHGFKNETLQNQIIKYKKFWFTKWTNFDFEKELNAKKSKEVY